MQKRYHDLMDNHPAHKRMNSLLYLKIFYLELLKFYLHLILN